ncbi:sel1 repeat family protein [bacterium]|nr:sel1 repeat family protein [bacterium]
MKKTSLVLFVFIFALKAVSGVDISVIAEAYSKLGAELKIERKTDKEYDKDLKKHLAGAKSGNAEEMYKLGRMIEAGEGSITSNIPAALKWYEKAASKKNPAAINHLAGMYMTGQGVQLDIDKGLELYKQSAALGNSDAMSNLGVLSEKGVGIKANEKAATNWYQKAADKGNAVAMLKLGKIFSRSSSDLYDKKKAVHWLEKSAEKGSSVAMHELASFYGANGMSNHRKIASLCMKSLEKGNNSAFGDIMGFAMAYEQMGISDSKIKEIGRKVGKRTYISVIGSQLDEDDEDIAVQDEHVDRLFINSEEFDLKKEDLPLIREGAYRDDEPGIFCLLYEDGETDYIKARALNRERVFQWYEKQAEKGDFTAMYQLGKIYSGRDRFSGSQKEREEFEKGVSMLKKCAENGDPYAMFALGEADYSVYARDYNWLRGKPKDGEAEYDKLKKEYLEIKSSMLGWYEKAAKAGNKRAKEKYDSVKADPEPWEQRN